MAVPPMRPIVSDHGIRGLPTPSAALRQPIHLRDAGGAKVRAVAAKAATRSSVCGFWMRDDGEHARGTKSRDRYRSDPAGRPSFGSKSGRSGLWPAEPLFDLIQKIVQLLDFVGALRLHGSVPGTLSPRCEAALPASTRAAAPDSSRPESSSSSNIGRLPSMAAPLPGGLLAAPTPEATAD